jgi:hypothetical protein
MRLKKEFFESLLFVIGSICTCALVLVSAEYQSKIKVEMPTLNDGITSLRTSMAAIEIGVDALGVSLGSSVVSSLVSSMGLPLRLPSLSALVPESEVERSRVMAAEMNLSPPAYSSEDEPVSIEAAASEQVALLLAKIEATLAPTEPWLCENPLPNLSPSFQFMAIAHNWTNY